MIDAEVILSRCRGRNDLDHLTGFNRCISGDVKSRKESLVCFFLRHFTGRDHLDFTGNVLSDNNVFARPQSNRTDNILDLGWLGKVDGYEFLTFRNRRRALLDRLIGSLAALRVGRRGIGGTFGLSRTVIHSRSVFLRLERLLDKQTEEKHG